MKRIVRRALGTITPPIFWGSMATSAKSRRARAPVRATPDMGPRELKYLLDDPVMVVPMERMRYPFAQRFTYEEHHFLRYYVDGIDALRRFYELHRPTSVFEAYRLPTPEGVEAPPFGPPWFKCARTHRGEGGLGPEHGDQSCGPVSEQKLWLEARRLDAVLDSIDRYGFRPDLRGYPQGYFLVREDGDWVFVIRGGVHRVAALAHRSFQDLEVRFIPHHPRTVDERDATAWPMVREALLTRDAALAIFRQFFQPRIPYPGA
jgi:hypothetical protein